MATERLPNSADNETNKNPGHLVLVSGMSGSGKTTLIQAALDQIPELRIVMAYTTRPIRPGEVDGAQYTFVSDEEYGHVRLRSKRWDGMEFGGYKYGADAAGANEVLRSGLSMICNVSPERAANTDLAGRYGVRPDFVWIDTPTSMAQARVAHDTIRANRDVANEYDIDAVFDHVFTPNHELVTDSAAFSQLVRSIIAPTE